MDACYRIAPSALAVLLVLLCLSPGKSRAAADLKISIGNPRLEHFDSDGGVQLDFGLTDPNGNPVGNLRPDNVKVYEDGKLAKILDFRGVGQGRPVDIVFVMDVTESMQPYVDAVKQNVIAFAHDLHANSRDYRLGLVTFEDYVISKEADCNCAYRDKFTSDVKTFTDWVGSLHAGGGGDIPEDELDALAYASKFPFRPEAEGIIILVTDAPPHHAGDGSANTAHDQSYWDHHAHGADVTNLTGTEVAAMLKKNGLTLYAVVPPPFIAPEYQEIVDATHGRSYNIVTEQGRFPSLVREIGHSIATEYSLTYRTPRPIEDGTNRSVELKIDYNGQNGAAETSYQVRGLGGAAINIPDDSGATTENGAGTGLRQLSFNWWNLAVPLIAMLGLFGLSRMRFGVSAEELKAIVAAQGRPSIPRPAAGPAPRPISRASAPIPPQSSPATAPRGAGVTRGARLVAVDHIDPVPAEYTLMKDEISIGRGEENDVVIPHASVSRQHARLMRRDGGFELMDLNSTNGSFVGERQVQGSAFVSAGTQLRLGDIKFVLQL
ncbi:MAG: FHA domain-containing protein [Candidatus Binatus sp.]|uniref:FHA domain-containing protein n=1 Tax=Candidatus Binatus sp. TaxID=2811406 RepID=UPI00271A6267|nr:FHA domain-containing protein [Candidatus Binatus sp.]MDO8434521.1 FHA domain-containing protein [Candidatus Binatus sp.]